MARQRTLLFATASDTDRMALRALFAPEREWLIIESQNGQDALLQAKKHGGTVDLFVIDVSLLYGDGLDAVRHLQAPKTVDCPPVVVLFPRGTLVGEAIPAGLFISESLQTPIEPLVGRRRLRSILELHDYQKKDVSYQHTVSRDPLLGLLNQNSLANAVDRALQNEENLPGILLHINVDDMKSLNERYGHHFGDLALVDIVAQLTRELPENAIIGRPHGDTFCAFIPSSSTRMDSIRMLENLKASLRQYYPEAPGAPAVVTVCMGASLAPDDGETFNSLYNRAETATAIAKQGGKDILLFYNAAMQITRQAKERARASISDDAYLRLSLEGRFVPAIRGDGNGIYGYDYYSLPQSAGIESMKQFIEFISRVPSKAAAHLLRVDIRHFFAFLDRLKAELERLPSLSFYTVLPGDQAGTLLHALREALERFPIDPTCLCINLAQEMVISMERNRLQLLAQELRAMGFQVGIHHVGIRYIPTICFDGHLFDRIIFSPEFTEDLLSNVYPDCMLEKVISSLQHEATTLCFPLVLSPTNTSLLSQALRGSSFCSYAKPFTNREAFRAHLKAHKPGPLSPPAIKQAFTFRIGADQYKDIFERSGIVIFEWRPLDNTIVFSETFEAVYGFQIDTLHLTEDLLEKIIHPDDLGCFSDALVQAKHGQLYMEGVMRVARGCQEATLYRWRRYSLIGIPDQNGAIHRVFCISFDIDREHRQLQDLKKLAETDQLTQLYNRGATEMHIKRFLKGDGASGKHALMMIDIDDFKTINDKLGHISGDGVLQYIAKQLKVLFRSGDIIGRIGGDEFMVLLKNIDSEAMIAGRAEDICRMFRAGNPVWNLSGTVGIARYPRDGQTFEALYAKADEALYDAKNVGKDQWAFYSSKHNHPFDLS